MNYRYSIPQLSTTTVNKVIRSFLDKTKMTLSIRASTIPVIPTVLFPPLNKKQAQELVFLSLF